MVSPSSVNTEPNTLTCISDPELAQHILESYLEEKMASYQNQFGNNPARQTEELGNQIHHPTTGTTHPSAMTAATGGDGNQFQPQKHREGMHGAIGGGVLRRSGSSSSSSSEDDGQGGRRKKGMKQKVMEKIPGQHNAHHQNNENQGGAYVNDHPTAGMAGEGGQEKKGIVDKIKNKLPGTH